MKNGLHKLGSIKSKLLKTHSGWRSLGCLIFAALIVWALPLHAELPSPSPSNPHQVYPPDGSLPRGIIGVAVQLSAHRVGDPARLYVRTTHPEGPAAHVGLEHGDEILAVDGNSVTGKTYEQIIRMIRGDIGQSVTLRVHGTRGTRDLTVPRVSEESLMKKNGRHTSGMMGDQPTLTVNGNRHRKAGDGQSPETFEQL